MKPAVSVAVCVLVFNFIISSAFATVAKAGGVEDKESFASATAVEAEWRRTPRLDVEAGADLDIFGVRGDRTRSKIDLRNSYVTLRAHLSKELV